MAYATLVMKNEKTDQIKNCPVGFSWTVMFFGFFPPLFRGDFKYSIIIFLCACVTFGLSSLVFMFLYNKLYIKDLVSNGFKAKSVSLGTIEQVSAKIGIQIEQID